MRSEATAVPALALTALHATLQVVDAWMPPSPLGRRELALP